MAIKTNDFDKLMNCSQARKTKPMTEDLRAPKHEHLVTAKASDEADRIFIARLKTKTPEQLEGLMEAIGNAYRRQDAVIARLRERLND